MEKENLKPHIKLQDLEVYKAARKLSQIAWKIYEQLDWRDKKVMGDQFLTSTDSFGANFAEGYARYHFLEKIKFFYNARASLVEALHWIDLLSERKKLLQLKYEEFLRLANDTLVRHQNFIRAIYKAKNQKNN